MQSSAVLVRLLDAPYHADCPYTYLLPDTLRGRLGTGSFVTVPFGGGNRRRAAVVVGFSSDTEVVTAGGKKIKLKPVLSVTQERYALSEEQLGLCSFLCESTLCTFGDAVHALLPAAAFSTLVECWRAAPDASLGEVTDEREASLLAGLSPGEELPTATLTRTFGPDTPELLRRLAAKGLVLRDFSVRESKNDCLVSYCSLAVDEAEAARLASGESTRLRSPAHRAIVGYLLTYGRSDWETVRRQTGTTRAQLRALTEKGILTEEKEEEYRNPYLTRTTTPRGENILSEEQTAAYRRLESLYAPHSPAAALLYGVTGSGKTRVIKAMVDRVLADGRRVIILVPEISLTPQTVDIFCGYYGSRVAVIHSSLSAGERYDAYKRIRAGEADVVIGTRSAVFAPVENLGMVVIDEEQEHTYKSDTSPKYHARDVARFRAAKNGALLLLASATPSLESYYKAKTGKYALIELSHRYGGARLPEVEVVDMRREAAAGNLSPVSRALLASLAQARERDQQSILFLNRRGYNHFAICRTCGEVVQCPQCSVSLTYHTSRPGVRVGEDAADRARQGYLVCHYCGYRREVPLLCPSCGGEHIAFLGYGTQRVEQELGEALPGLRVLRMDTDTTQAKFSYESLLGRFRAREADLLLGTQMVTKGHDFPLVTVVGVLDADSALHLDDYRAGERTFSLITQVIGRAGRADAPGRAVIQTHLPDDETIRLACRQDYAAFYEKEIVLRKNYLFPPFCDVVLLSVTGEDEGELHRSALKLSAGISALVAGEYADTPVVAFGPFESPIYKLGGRFRLRMVFKCRLSARSRGLFARVLRELVPEMPGKVSATLDLNPSNI